MNGINSINFPISIDWFNGIASAIFASVLASIINSRIKNEINDQRTIGSLSSLIISMLLLLLFWYNAIGIIYAFIAVKQQDSVGCGNAIYTYESAIEWNPKLTGARWGLVNCAITLQRIEDTIPIIERQQSKLSNDPEYWKQLSILYLKTNNQDSMLRALSVYADMQSDDIEDWTYKIGWELMNERKHIETETAMRLFRSRAENNKVTAYWLAWALLEQGKYQDALMHFDICISDYETLEANFYLGRCYAGKGFANLYSGYTLEAKEAFIEAISIYPDQQDVKDTLIQIP